MPQFTEALERKAVIIEDTAYVLHTYPHKESSLLIELFAKEKGRLMVVAKGARRPLSQFRGLIQAFQPLLGSWSGKNEIKTLHKLELEHGISFLQGDAMICGFYLNELLLRLLPIADPHESLFAVYADTLHKLSQNKGDRQIILRQFELKLLELLGYKVPLTYDSSGLQIERTKNYYYIPEVGAVPEVGATDSLPLLPLRVKLRGNVLLDMANSDYSHIQTQRQSKQLMRHLVCHYLNGRPLHTRQLLKELLTAHQDNRCI